MEIGLVQDLNIKSQLFPFCKTSSQNFEEKSQNLGSTEKPELLESFILSSCNVLTIIIYSDK